MIDYTECKQCGNLYNVENAEHGNFGAAWVHRFCTASCYDKWKDIEADKKVDGLLKDEYMEKVVNGHTGNVVNLDLNGKIAFAEMIDELKDDKVTHAVMCYRRDDGDLCYRILGADHTTFLVGMLDRVKMAIHHDDSHNDDYIGV